MNNKEITIIMGSQSDMPIMSDAAKVIDDFGLSYEMNIVSAHRTPEHMFSYASSAYEKGFRIIIAGAGGAAHLPGMVASLSTLPVIGVPLRSKNSLDGWDSILSILQMPTGIPVATVALNQAKNAALLAIRILAISNTKLAEQMQKFMAKQRDEVLEKSKSISKNTENNVY